MTRITMLVGIAAWAAVHLPAQALGGDQTAVWEHLRKTYDADGDGKISIAEYPRGERSFRNLDRDGDGALTAADFERRRGGGNARGERNDMGRMVATSLGRSADGDGDGTVSPAEWSAFVAELGGADGSAIATDELVDLLPMRGRGGQGNDDRMAQMVVRAFDRDGDGEVTRKDLDRLFAELDRNRDGSLQRNEIGTDPRQGRGNRSPARELPKAGEPAPDFELPFAHDGDKTMKLSSFAGKKPVALIFGSYT